MTEVHPGNDARETDGRATGGGSMGGGGGIQTGRVQENEKRRGVQVAGEICGRMFTGRRYLVDQTTGLRGSVGGQGSQE